MIEYEVIKQFGNERKFIIDEDLSEAFYLLTGRKTLKDKDIENLKKLGVKICPINSQMVDTIITGSSMEEDRDNFPKSLKE